MLSPDPQWGLCRRSPRPPPGARRSHCHAGLQTYGEDEPFPPEKVIHGLEGHEPGLTCRGCTAPQGLQDQGPQHPLPGAAHVGRTWSLLSRQLALPRAPSGDRSSGETM